MQKVGRLRGGWLARKEKATAWAVGLRAGEQASRQACTTLGLCPLGKLGLRAVGSSDTAENGPSLGQKQ